MPKDPKTRKFQLSTENRVKATELIKELGLTLIPPILREGIRGLVIGPEDGGTIVLIDDPGERTKHFSSYARIAEQLGLREPTLAQYLLFAKLHQLSRLDGVYVFPISPHLIDTATIHSTDGLREKERILLTLGPYKPFGSSEEQKKVSPTPAAYAVSARGPWTERNCHSVGDVCFAFMKS